MWRCVLMAIAAANALVGCSTVADFDVLGGYRGVTVAQIVDKIDCEIYDALIETNAANNPIFQALRKRAAGKAATPVINPLTHQFFAEPTKDLRNWVASVILTLQVDDGVGLTPTLSYTTPLNLAGTSFSFGGSANLGETRQRAYTQTYTITIAKLDERKVRTNCENEAWEAYDLQGNLGIKELVYMGFTSLDTDDQGATGYGTGSKPDSIAGVISFAVVKNVSAVGPTWTLLHFKGPGGVFGANRTDTHKISIGFSPIGNLIDAQNLAIDKAAGLPHFVGRAPKVFAAPVIQSAATNASNAAINANLNSAISTLTNSIRIPGM